MNPFRFLVITLSLELCVSSGFALDEPLFHATDPLAARDEWGLLGQGPLNPTDFERRHPLRWCYYLEGRNTLVNDPAYVGALQACMCRLGYYRGPIDGVFSDELSFAIARLQKAHAMRVTGTLTIPVRRVLYLP
ncbi:MAG: peptidoglycan-binding protein [Verrucomicrobiota bacterium]|nr:peptidoglycan-binding protein [Verrucomicrobiota bacterium]